MIDASAIGKFSPVLSITPTKLYNFGQNCPSYVALTLCMLQLNCVNLTM